uniref:Uncharacterized protein n=1 Tax=Anguilla anguilla TaxID=7936 RepID=A0A0E9SJH4_ANGAN
MLCSFLTLCRAQSSVLPRDFYIDFTYSG